MPSPWTGGGNAYVVGYTDSADFPTTAGAYDGSYNGDPEYLPTDAFLAMLDPTLSCLSYATFLGGSNEDSGEAIALDGAGNVYVAGTTESANFPTTDGAYDTSYNEGNGYTRDAFLGTLDVGVAPPNLSRSAKTIGQVGVEAGDRITYAIRLLNCGSLSTTFTLTDPIPMHATYVSGNVRVGGGGVTDADGIIWSGTLTGTTSLTATFAVTVDAAPTQPTAIVNAATLAGDPDDPLVLRATAIVNALETLVPLVLRNR